MSAEIVHLAARRPQPEASPFEGVTDVVRFDIGRRPVPAPGPTQEERIAALEEETRRLRETNASLLEVLSSLLLEVRAVRARAQKPLPVEDSDAQV